jgi:hypothetical protein
LKENFSKVLIESTKILETQVPIIKLKIDLSKYYDLQMKMDPSLLPYVNFDSIESINPHLKTLCVDVSICDSFDSTDHQGIKAAYFVRDKLEEYPVLRPVCLMLKTLIK